VKFDWVEGTADVSDCESSGDEDGDGDADGADETNGDHQNRIEDDDAEVFPPESDDNDSRDCDFSVALTDEVNSSINPYVEAQPCTSTYVEAQPCSSNQYKIVGDNIDKKH